MRHKNVIKTSIRDTRAQGKERERRKKKTQYLGHTSLGELYRERRGRKERQDVKKRRNKQSPYNTQRKTMHFSPCW